MDKIKLPNDYLLIEAINSKCSLDTINILLNEGIDVNIKDQKGKTALIYAIETMNDKRIEIVKALINAGAEIKNEYNLIANAIKNGDSNIVKTLLDAGLDSNHKDKFGNTYLIQAVLTKNSTIVSDLLRHGSDINAKNTDNDSALMLAVDKNLLITRLLIDAGANVNDKNNNGTSALMKATAISSYRGPDSIGSAFSLFAAIKLIDWTYSKLSGYRDLIPVSDIPKVIDSLIDAGANIKEKDNNGETALMYAAKYGTLKAIERLTKRKGFESITSRTNRIDLNAVNNEGYTALMLTIKHGSFDKFKYLLELKADFNIQSKNGETALTMAKSAGYEEYVKALLDLGARF